MLTAWDARRWLVTMMSTAGHSQDTAINLVDIALRLEREGLAARTVFYLIQNKYDNRDDNRPAQLRYTDGELGQREKLARLLQRHRSGLPRLERPELDALRFQIGRHDRHGSRAGRDHASWHHGRARPQCHGETISTPSPKISATALADPDLIIVIPGRGTTNTLTELGQGSQLIEEGHRSFLRRVS